MTLLPAAIFLGAATLAPLARLALVRRFGEPVQIRTDPLKPSARHLAECFAAVAVSLDERPRPLRVSVTTANARNRRFQLTDGRNRVFRVELDGDRPAKLDLRGRWIADHPVPLRFDPRRSVTLYFQPAEANRFRVSCRPPFKIPRAASFLLLAVAVSGAVMIGPCMIAFASGGALGMAIATNATGRFPGPSLQALQRRKDRAFSRAPAGSRERASGTSP